MPITAGDEAPGPGPAGGDEVRRVPASRPKNPCSKRRERERSRTRAARRVTVHGWGRGGMREGMEGLKISGSKRVKRAKMHSAFRPIMTSEVLYTLGWRPLAVYKE